MQLGERQVGGVDIIDVAGDLIVPVENPRVLRERVVGLIHRGARRILLNWEHVQRMDSTCLGEIVESYKIANSNGVILKFASGGENLRNLLRTTGLDKVFESYDTEQDALASFATTPELEPGRTVISSASLWPSK